MRRQALLDRITVDPDVCSGKPCVSGHMLCVSTVLDDLAEGCTLDEVVRRHPGIDVVDVHACLAYATQIVYFLEEGFIAAR
jgi:uncharacterized protein (DUF433 family)